MSSKPEQQKHTPWYTRAGAACSIVPVSRFVSPTVFALKTGGYGCLFSLSGIDEESLTNQELDARVRSIEASLRGLPEGARLYQYARVSSGFEIPRQKSYDHPATDSFVADRLSHLQKTANFRRIELRWCLTFEPPKGIPSIENLRKRPAITLAYCRVCRRRQQFWNRTLGLQSVSVTRQG